MEQKEATHTHTNKLAEIMIEHIQDQLFNHVMALAILQLSDNLEFCSKTKKRQFNTLLLKHLVVFSPSQTHTHWRSLAYSVLNDHHCRRRRVFKSIRIFLKSYLDHN